MADATADATASGGNDANGSPDANQDGHSAGTGGSGGGGSDGGPSGFVCNQVTAMTLTREWFEAGFETDNGIVDAKWQLKAHEHGYITEWSNPNSTFWSEKLESPCSSGSTNPDHVVLTVLSWVPACCTTQSQWATQVEGAVSTLKAKYSALKRIDLMTVIRGPGNTRCPADPTAGETIVMPPELDAALAATATKFPGLVFVAPKFEASQCWLSGGGPHLTTAGNTAVADIAAYFAKLQ